MKSLIFGFFLVSASLISNLSCEKVSFENYQLWRLYPQNVKQFEYIHNLELTDNEVS